MITIDDFLPIKIEDKNIFEKIYMNSPPAHSDYLFSTLITWKDYAKYRFANLGKSIIIMTEFDNRINFRPPLGHPNKELYDNLIKIAKKEGTSDNPIGLIDTRAKEEITKYYPNITLTPHRDYFEYVYNANELAELKGGNYSKIRNRLNKFTKKHKYTIEAITEDNKKEAKKFLERWCLWRDCEGDPLLEHEKKAIFSAMNNFFELDLESIAIRLNDEIEALSIFEYMNKDTAVVHFEKGAPDYDGIYKAINKETAKIVKEKVTYINRESDMGIPGLRKAKLSYRPHHMVEVYHIKKPELQNF